MRNSLKCDALNDKQIAVNESLVILSPNPRCRRLWSVQNRVGICLLVAKPSIDSVMKMWNLLRRRLTGSFDLNLGESPWSHTTRSVEQIRSGIAESVCVVAVWHYLKLCFNVGKRPPDL
jgi:hypothetical protein